MCWARDRPGWASCLTRPGQRRWWGKCPAWPASVWRPAVSTPTPGSSAVSDPAAGAGSLSRTLPVWRPAAGAPEYGPGSVSLISHHAISVSSQEKFRCIEEEEGEVLGFIQHSPFLSVTKKVLSPVRRADQLCNNSCCLLDNMMIFQADNWTALRDVRLRK